jgi:hypothetical protein
MKSIDHKILRDFVNQIELSGETYYHQLRSASIAFIAAKANKEKQTTVDEAEHQFFMTKLRCEQYFRGGCKDLSIYATEHNSQMEEFTRMLEGKTKAIRSTLKIIELYEGKVDLSFNEKSEYVLALEEIKAEPVDYANETFDYNSVSEELERGRAYLAEILTRFSSLVIETDDLATFHNE